MGVVCRLNLRELGPWAAHMRWLVWIMACVGSAYVFFFHEKYASAFFLIHFSCTHAWERYFGLLEHDAVEKYVHLAHVQIAAGHTHTHTHAHKVQHEGNIVARETENIAIHRKIHH